MSVPALLAARRVAPWAPRALPFLCYMLFLAAEPLAAHLLPDARWMYGIRIAAVSALFGLFARGYAELWRVPKLDRCEIAIAVATGVLVFVLWINLDLAPFVIGTAPGFDPRDATGRIDWPLALVRCAGAALVVPVMEELFWRSFVMRRFDRANFLALDPRTCSQLALLASSIVFGLEHTLWFAGILAGLAYAWLYRRRGNLWSAIVAHAVTNLLLAIWVLGTANWQFW